MKFLRPLLSCFLLCNTVLAIPQESSMPVVSGKNLNGAPWSAPKGLPGDRTLVLIGFDEPQQAAIDTWTQGLGLDHPTNVIPWIEMPLIENPGMFMRWFINAGMKGSIPSKKVRSHVWTAYTDKKAFMQSCGMRSEKVIYALVLDRKGHILALEAGVYTKPGAEKLLRALKT